VERRLDRPKYRPDVDHDRREGDVAVVRSADPVDEDCVNPGRELVNVAGETGAREQWQTDRDRGDEAKREERELPPAPGCAPGGQRRVTQ
jgi:hypothetical protein